MKKAAKSATRVATLNAERGRTMSVLSDRELANNQSLVTPFPDWDDIRPANIVLHLGDTFRFFHVDWRPLETMTSPRAFDFQKDSIDGWMYSAPYENVLLDPGDCVLAHTEETLDIPNNMCALVDTPTDLARLFVTIHIGSIVVSPGFRGQLTLEIKNHSPIPIIIYAGMEIAKLVVMFLSSPSLRGYGIKPNQKYQGQTGPQPSLIHLNKGKVFAHR